MKNIHEGRYILIGTTIGLIIGIIISFILSNKLVTPVLGTSIGFLCGATLERYKNKKSVKKSP